MIWVDVDGVLADFEAYVEATYRLVRLPGSGYDIIGDVIRSGRTWVEPDWKAIPLTGHAKSLVQWIDGMGVNGGYCTACEHPDRVVWLQWFRRRTDTETWPIALTSQKSYVVRESDVLFDDCPQEGWCRHIRVPAKWWRSDWGTFDVMEEIKSAFM